ncbi:MAG: hypothetical protein ACJ0Q6_04995 [Candidatus Azotimanducaceae bacterium]|uniref:Acyl-CoA dehydrogenase C-terminal domain-containing protein n=1 Tax=OM182 bacterium TaxID=2510334 RepID=A0A520RYL2_9GAMM|nr:hypothetical protein [Gammaproteobacteria bacterium]RZO75336.1 MAG: hypothetical protein EVA68_07215 [OM182 bacterium]
MPSLNTNITDLELDPHLLRTVEVECPQSTATELPNPVVKALRAKQGFSLLLPQFLGGKQPSFPTFIEFAQAVATADGSAGWCVTQGSVLSSLARFLPTDVAKSVWTTPDVSLANGPKIEATTVKVEDNFILSGSWWFSSGINHATWLLGVATLKKNKESESAIWHLFKKSEAQILKNWDVAGLRGTGSYQFDVKELHVPESMTFEVKIRKEDPPLYQIPLNLMFACGFAAVALGISRSALDFAKERVKTKIKRMETKKMSDDLLTQDQIGRAEALWQSANLYLKSQVQKVWQDICEDSKCSLENRILLRLAGTHTIHQAKAVTDLVYNLCSTDSILQTNDLQKRFQDIHVISQHMQGRPEIYSLVGRHYLDLPIKSHLL